jgi:hypothetical protein
MVKLGFRPFNKIVVSYLSFQKSQATPKPEVYNISYE